VAVLAAPAFAERSATTSRRAADFDPAIPTPQQFLGYEIGSRYTRHDQVVAYFNELAGTPTRSPSRRSAELRGQAALGGAGHLAAANQAADRRHPEAARTLADPAQPLSAAGNSAGRGRLYYGVHGNETSSGEAALLTAYYLVANRSADRSRTGSTRRWC
jgi:hypothetical protein